MILAFGDSHLGVKTYSTQDAEGFYTAEKDSIKSLEEIYARCAKGDITLLLGLGDIYHTNNPTNKIITFLIDWIQRIDKLSIPVKIIPGNHDDSFYSHSLDFLKSLQTTNVQLIDSTNSELNTYAWQGWRIYFAPYCSSYNLKQKNELVYSDVKSLLEKSFTKSIIVTHVEESSCKLGSESQIIAKGVDIIDIDNIHDTKDIILLSGHIHLPQIYKKGRATVCYPGSTICMESLDANQRKGYVLIDNSGNITYEYFKTTRRFVRYDLPEDISPIDHLSSFRMPGNEVVFITVPDKGQKYDESAIAKFLSSTGSMFGKLKYIKQDITEQELQSVFSEKADPFKIYTSWINTNIEKFTPPVGLTITTQAIEQRALQLGIKYIEKTLQSVKE